MKQNIELSKHREFGDIISDTLKFIKQNFMPLLKAYFVICSLFLIADILLTSLAKSDTAQYYPSDTLSAVKFSNIFFSLISYTAINVTILSYLAVYKEKGNEAPTATEVWGYFKYYYFRAFFMQLLLMI
jgi:hypothetical protein